MGKVKGAFLHGNRGNIALLISQERESTGVKIEGKELGSFYVAKTGFIKRDGKVHTQLSMQYPKSELAGIKSRGFRYGSFGKKGPVGIYTLDLDDFGYKSLILLEKDLLNDNIGDKVKLEDVSPGDLILMDTPGLAVVGFSHRIYEEISGKEPNIIDLSMSNLPRYGNTTAYRANKFAKMHILMKNDFLQTIVEAYAKTQDKLLLNQK
ncbi:MAG: hypothetical protein ABH828_06360 [archaeon]